jgi:hypothetical protein
MRRLASAIDGYQSNAAAQQKGRPPQRSFVLDAMEIFTTLEKDAIAHLIQLSDLPTESKDILNNQLKAAQLKNRDITGAGFFTDFIIPAEVTRLPQKERLYLDCVGVELNGVPDAAAFILFIRDGAIHLLEGFTLAIDRWSPYEGEPYKLKRIIWTQTGPTSKSGKIVDI